jgi:hypothetical protein
MRKFLFSLFILLAGYGISFAQNSASPRAQEATDKLAALYNLTPEQTARMLKIQEREVRNFKEISSMKRSDESLYYQNLKALRDGTQISIQMLLTEAQMPAYHQERLNQRVREAEVANRLMAEGATPLEIQRAVLEME